MVGEGVCLRKDQERKREGGGVGCVDKCHGSGWVSFLCADLREWTLMDCCATEDYRC